MHRLSAYSLSSPRNFTLFLLVLCFHWIFLFLADYLLIADSLYYDLLGNKLSYERINQIIEESKKWKWVSYALIPPLVLIKCFLISSCLYIGGFFSKADKSISDFFRIIILAEFLLFLPVIVKIAWFGFIHRNYGLNDLTSFSPFSVFNMFDKTEVDVWFIYPLQLLNIFELLYWFLLAYLLKYVINKNFSESLGFVASTYGVGLFIWVLVVTFLTVSLS